MRLAILLLLIISNLNFTFSQKQGNIWYFGARAGLDFNSGSPIQIFDGKIATTEGCAVISNEDGELLFYSNGGGRLPVPTGNSIPGSIWNKNHEVFYNMLGEEGGGWSSAQSSLITPKPGDSDNYYLFTMEESEFDSDGDIPGQPDGRGFSYFEIDMSQNGGLGDVVDYQEMIVVPSYESLSGTVHSNGVDFWIMIMDEADTTLQVLSVDSAGVNPHFSFPMGVYIDQGFGYGIIKISPDGKHVMIRGVMLDFDNETGILSNPVLIENAKSYSCAFSPNSRYLYITSPDFGGYKVLKFEIKTTDVAATEKKIGHVQHDGSVGGLQVAPDGNIYILEQVFFENRADMSVIKCPNSKYPCVEGKVFQFNYGVFDYDFLGLPNFTDHYFRNEGPIDTFSVSIEAEKPEVCVGQELELIAESLIGNTFQWSTGETGKSIKITNGGIYGVTVTDDCCAYGTAEIEISETEPQDLELQIIGDSVLCENETEILTAQTNIPVEFLWSTGETLANILVTNGGEYSVTVTDECNQTEIDQIEINAFNSLELTVQTEGELFCDANSVLLSVQTNAQNIEWSTGESTPEIEIEEPGNYSVTISNPCETAYEEILIETPENIIQIPNAFTPDNDAVNDSFGPVWGCKNVNGFSMQIYNRWGRQVFSTNVYGEEWNGENQASDVYIYRIRYVDKDGFSKEFRGDVTLLR